MTPEFIDTGGFAAKLKKLHEDCMGLGDLCLGAIITVDEVTVGELC